MSLDEKLQILTPEGRPTGRLATRKEVHEQNLWHRCVHVFVRNGRNEFIVQKRSMNKRIAPGLLDMSCGGHAVGFDDSLTAARREMEEEIGIVPDEENLEHLGEVVYADGIWEYCDVYLLTVEFDPAALRWQEDEIDGLLVLPYLEMKEAYEKKNGAYLDNDDSWALLFERVDGETNARRAPES